MINNILGLISLICGVWVIYDVLAVNKKLSTGMKVLWIFLVLLPGINIITAIVYYFIEKK